MGFEVLVRYAVPGTLFLAPLGILALLDPSLGSLAVSGLGVFAIGAMIPVGYLIHQFWFALFESRGGYVSMSRPNLYYLLQQCGGDRHQIETPAGIRHSYYTWKYRVYGPQVPSGHLGRARRLWQTFCLDTGLHPRNRSDSYSLTILRHGLCHCRLYCLCSFGGTPRIPCTPHPTRGRRMGTHDGSRGLWTPWKPPIVAALSTSRNR